MKCTREPIGLGSKSESDSELLYILLGRTYIEIIICVYSKRRSISTASSHPCERLSRYKLDT